MTKACILVGYGVHVYGFSLLAMHLCRVFTDPPAANNLLLAIGITYTHSSLIIIMLCTGNNCIDYHC